MSSGPGGVPDYAAEVARLIHEAPFAKYAPAFLRIETKKGEIKPFALNDAQLIVDREVERQRALGRPIRVLILKGRQQGMSTYCQMRIARRVLSVPGTKALTVTHTLATANALYSKFDRARKELYSYIGKKPLSDAERGALGLDRPKVAAGGERGRLATFDDPMRTSYRCDSAHDPENVGRGLTIHVAHLTETPLWKRSDETMQSLLATIPDDPDTEVYVENTAKGASGWFYETWIAAMRDIELGIEPEFVPVFVAWFETREYRRPRRPGEPRLDERERELRDEYKLSNEQMYWYRDQVRKFGDRVVEEYPFHWREAFLSSGMSFIQNDAIDYYTQSRTAPLHKIRFAGRKVGGSRRLRPVKDPKGSTWIWEMPAPGVRYTVGVDFASGRSKDYSAIVVYDADSLSIVATHRSKMLPDEVLTEAVCLGYMYNTALLVPERTGIGQNLVDTLVNVHRYPHVYREHDPTAVKFHGGARFGWATSNSTKLGLLEELAFLVHSRSITIPCPRVVEDLSSLAYSDDGGKKVEAREGCFDDMAMAAAFAVRGTSRLPLARTGSARAVERRAYISRRAGY